MRSNQFTRRFKSEVECRIVQDGDQYGEIKYSRNIFVHVASHPNGEGSFELEAIVPHNSQTESFVSRGSEHSTLPSDMPDVEDFYVDIEEILTEVTGKEFSDLTFQLSTIVDDGAWEKDATVYSTFELTA